MSNKTVDELAQFIAKNISYDGSETESELRCQKCGHVVRPQFLNYWIDHRQVLASNIARFMGLRIWEKIDDILNGAFVTGNAKLDSLQIAKEIIEQIYE